MNPIDERHRKAIKRLQDMKESGMLYLFNNTVRCRVTNVYQKDESVFIEIEEEGGKTLVHERELYRINAYVDRFEEIQSLILDHVPYTNKGWYEKLAKNEGVVWSPGKKFACFVFSTEFSKENRLDGSMYLDLFAERGTKNIFVFKGSPTARRKLTKKSGDRYGFMIGSIRHLFVAKVYTIEHKTIYGKVCWKLIPKEGAFIDIDEKDQKKK